MRLLNPRESTLLVTATKQPLLKLLSADVANIDTKALSSNVFLPATTSTVCFFLCALPKLAEVADGALCTSY